MLLQWQCLFYRNFNRVYPTGYREWLNLQNLTVIRQIAMIGVSLCSSHQRRVSIKDATLATCRISVILQILSTPIWVNIGTILLNLYFSHFYRPFFKFTFLHNFTTLSAIRKTIKSGLLFNKLLFIVGVLLLNDLSVPHPFCMCRDSECDTINFELHILMYTGY